MSKWDSEKENLEKYILVDKLPYTEIGRIYGCTDNNIKKVARNLGIKLPVRNAKNSERAPINKGTGKKYYCLNCGKEIIDSHGNIRKYCSNQCQRDYEYKQWVKSYKLDNSIAKSTKWGKICRQLRRYIFEKFENKCCYCGWSEINPYTNTLPLEIDHIDGDSNNNSEENLRLLCPNCHSLTSTYRGANRGYGRNITWTIKDEEENEK
jgi:hypothetical protein